MEQEIRKRVLRDEFVNLLLYGFVGHYVFLFLRPVLLDPRKHKKIVSGNKRITNYTLVFLIALNEPA